MLSTGDLPTLRRDNKLLNFHQRKVLDHRNRTGKHLHVSSVFPLHCRVDSIINRVIYHSEMSLTPLIQVLSFQGVG